jgi:Tol biopolymer transport system component
MTMRSRHLFPTLALAGAFTLGACSADESTAPITTQPTLARAGGGGKNAKDIDRLAVVWLTVVGQTPDIFTINADGTNMVRLTTTAIGYGGSYTPHWTTDHSKIVFISERSGQGEVYTMNADGSKVKQLTSDGTRKSDAVPSPDGSKIVFRRHDANGGLFVMNFDGTNVLRLTSHNDDMHPAWWTGTNKILFAGHYFGLAAYNIFSMNSDGSGLTQQTSCYVDCLGPSLSPDGAHFAFWAAANNGEIIRFDGSFTGSARILVQNLGLNEKYPPAWSQDGSKIAYVRNTFGSREVWTASSFDGSGETQVTNYGSAAFISPSWYR